MLMICSSITRDDITEKYHFYGHLSDHHRKYVLQDSMVCTFLQMMHRFMHFGFDSHPTEKR